MRRMIFLTVGLLELVVAALLVCLGFQVPSAAEVTRGFDGAERVTRRAGNQVRLLQQQVHDLRRPELQRLAEGLQAQTREVASTLRSRSVDYETVRTLRDALGDVGKGLDGFARTLDPNALGKLGDSLEATATFIEDSVIPSADKAAKQLEESTAALKDDADRLSTLVRQAPLDLKAAREVHDSLGHFSDGLDTLTKTLQPRRLDTIRNGFDGLETSLNSGAAQVKRLSGYHYPVVTFRGAKPSIEQKPFWPEGDEIAEGMEKAAAGAKEAAQELDDVAADLPKVRSTLAESRKVVDKTREALGTALKQQDKIEPLLKDLPEQTARLAKELPRLGTEMSKALRNTRQLKEVATALRQARKGMQAAQAGWPDLRKTLHRSATVLGAIHDQLDDALKHRKEYEAALHQSVVLAETAATTLPLLTNQVNDQLAEQEEALGDLGDSIDEVGMALPVYSETTSRVLLTGRLLSWLVALIVALHGVYLLLSVRLGRRFSF